MVIASLPLNFANAYGGVKRIAFFFAYYPGRQQRGGTLSSRKELVPLSAIRLIDSSALIQSQQRRPQLMTKVSQSGPPRNWWPIRGFPQCHSRALHMRRSKGYGQARRRQKMWKPGN